MLVTFEEERIEPRRRTLRYLAMTLKSNNQKVPFNVPDVADVPSVPASVS